MKGIRFSLLLFAPTLLCSLETKPWFGNVYECIFDASYTYSRYSKVQGAAVQLRSPSNDQRVALDLSIPPSEMWDVQAEIEFVNTPRQSWGYRSAAIQGRARWLNDICGDPVSLTTGLNVREVSSKSLRDVSSPYHAKFDIELNTAVGKEWSEGSHWTMRTWGFAGVGIGNQGSPWITALGVFEKNWDDHHRTLFFAEGYFGFGEKEHVNVKHFHGWGRFHHQSIDLGLAYQYHFHLYGDITVLYAHRVFAHVFPEHVNFFTIAYKIPFSCF